MLDFLTIVLLVLVAVIGYRVLESSDDCQFCTDGHPVVTVQDYKSGKVYRICIPCIKEKLK